MFKGIDFSSDTVTKPSQSMKMAMMDASLGDEQKGEDPTTRYLEEEVARRLKKSAAMFFPSATLCNQIAIRLQVRPGEEVIGASNCHIFNSEGGGAAFHSSAQTRMIQTKDGTYDGQQVKDHVRHVKTPYSPKTALLLVENTTNSGGGAVWALEQLRSVTRVAKELGILAHLDGSRLFNASIALGVDVDTLAEGFDTITICFSKGLGCAMGAILVFDQERWTDVRNLKQVFGGAMRQSGILAAGCLYALENNLEQLATDHQNAKILAQGLSQIPGIVVENPVPMSNIVFFAVEPQRVDPAEFLGRCLEHKFRFSQGSYNRFRAVTHRDLTLADIEEALEKLKRVVAG